MKSSLDLITTPTEVCLIDQYEKAYILTEMFKDIFTYPKGIYSNTNIYPIIYEEGSYLINDQYIKGKEIDIDKVYNDKIPVYNLKGRMILNPNKKLKLSFKPVLPYIGLHLMAIWILHSILFENSRIEDLNDRMEYTFYNKVNDYFRMIMKPDEPIELIKEKIIPDIDNVLDYDRVKDIGDNTTEYSILSTLLLKFIGKDIYHIYDVNIVKSYIEVSKFVDFRIYEWTKLKEESRRDNNN